MDREKLPPTDLGCLLRKQHKTRANTVCYVSSPHSKATQGRLTPSLLPNTMLKVTANAIKNTGESPPG